VSKPIFGLVFVIPPVWHEPHDAPNKRLPRLTCSAVNTVDLPEESRATVRVASSNSIALAAVEPKRETPIDNAKILDFFKISLCN
jgi:hypothetical protein